MAQQSGRPAESEARHYGALVGQYCLDCHDAIEARGNLILEDLDLGQIGTHAAVLEKVAQKIRSSAMPPVGRPRPDPATYQAFAAWLEGELDRHARQNPNPGRPATYRLNRAQYKAAIRDLLALDVDVDALMAPDNSSYGFDNVADVLTVSPALLESFLAAADRVSALAVGDPSLPLEETFYRVSQRFSQHEHIPGLPLGTRGGMQVEHYFPLDGVYEISPRFLKNTVGAIRGLQFPHQFEVSVDGQRMTLITMGGLADYTRMMEDPESQRVEIEERVRLRLPLTAGYHEITVTFLHKTGARDVAQLQPFESVNFDPVYLGGNPSVEGVLIRGPYEAKAPSVETASRKAIFTCRPRSPREEGRCADQILSRIARAAYRRPVSETDMTVLRAFYDRGYEERGGFEGGIQMGLRRILSSPDFLFRLEHEPANVAPGTAYRISDFDLASRLSFFLWNSIPDEELLEVAERGQLRNPQALEQQVRRMLADPRSQALIDVFAGQWLRLRNLESVQPDALAYPNFDDTLREAFKQETTLFFGSIVREDRSVMDLINADYTFLNERLARHYGIPGVSGSDFRRVQVTDEMRRGLLGHGSILTVTSFPHRTSPVKRGQWVLDTLLASPPADPPDDVPALEENNPASLDQLSLRARLQQHRDNPACASCHNVMDPIGYAMEVFDGIGAKRMRDESGERIDPSGTLADGTPIQGVADLREAIAANPEMFVRAFTEKLLIYALGRGLEHYDKPVVRSIARAAAAQDYRFSSIVLEIVRSTPFQMKMAGGSNLMSASGASQPLESNREVHRARARERG